ncbi:hypothetical protein PFICI_07334 [Pestalotiopsis fici W106-1]|uniref:Terpene synthase n=1 Tax=Pestalotiopsis fici (strain W106-1 / CGMCC3.15140) TaxID=1229662 RepID=W3X157_PESFW|nr:uncharacterized protein PFICI_07334 [Pestalotiopsis fici W106-1]ETS79805.1 hypothetical protein PFICI_07334 [Pestalotiopsis fici W106-1]
MEPVYSKELDDELYPRNSLSCDIPVRIHRNSQRVIRGARKAQADWSALVTPSNNFKGIIGDLFSFIEVTVPECLPDRLEITSYVVEFAYLGDDTLEKYLAAKNNRAESQMLQTFGAEFDPDSKLKEDAQKQLQSQIFSKMAAIDLQRATVAMKSWATFIQQAKNIRKESFQTLQEYIPARIIDVGESIWFGMLTFAMGLTIPDDEYELCRSLARPAYTAMGLTNDLFSWEMERDMAERLGQDHVFNAVYIIMNEHSVNEDVAKAICAKEVIKLIEDFKRNVSKIKDNTMFSKDLRVYTEALLYSYSGNLAWSPATDFFRANDALRAKEFAAFVTSVVALKMASNKDDREQLDDVWERLKSNEAVSKKTLNWIENPAEEGLRSREIGDQIELPIRQVALAAGAPHPLGDGANPEASFSSAKQNATVFSAKFGEKKIFALELRTVTTPWLRRRRLLLKDDGLEFDPLRLAGDGSPAAYLCKPIVAQDLVLDYFDEVDIEDLIE